MQSFDPSGLYGTPAVLSMLQGLDGARTVDFRYDLLDATNRQKAAIVGMLPGCSIAYDSSADVKRTATFVLRDGFDSIDYLSDRIKPWIRFQMSDGGWVEWPQGVFLLSSPTRSLSTTGTVTRSVEAYDQLVILSGDAVSDRYSIPVGQMFTSAIGTIIDGLGFATAITPSTLVLPVTWDYEAGTSKLTILNDLLSAMGYRSAWFDENGVLVCAPYILPANVTPSYTYRTDDTSTIIGQVDQSLDLFNVPNKWTLVVSDTDQGSFSSTFTNTDPNSPTSTVRRGRTVLSFDSGQSAADAATLFALTQKKAYEDSQVYETVPFSTAIMPFHSNADVLGLTVNDLGLVNVKYEELSWQVDLSVGGNMTHNLRRVVSTVGGS